MEQEDINYEGTDKLSEMPFNPQSSEKYHSKKDTGSPEGYLNNMELEDSKKGTENLPEVSSNPQSPEKDDSKKDIGPPEGYLNNMELENSKKGTENPPELSRNPQSSEKADSKKDTDPPEGYLYDMEQVDNTKSTENPPEISSNPLSSEKDDSKKDTGPPDGSSKPELSDKHTPQSLKAKSKIVKKSQSSKFKTKKNEGSRQIQGKKRIRKNKKAVGNAESSRNTNEKQISDDRQQMKTNDEPPLQEAEKNKEKESQNRSTSNKSPIEEQDQTQKNKDIVVLDKSEQKQNNNESKKSSRNRRKKDKRSGMEKSQSKEKKGDKLGGVIFMCNAKTKPDCFHYRVMGVSAGKKDDVLSVKPGLKLFLYDFDLKLLYGIYKASSSGGMKLEPRAFRGKFPAQVRFKIASDCYPLPENIFKKAIKENYNGRNKFKTELTVRQVRKLTALFRPVEVHSALPPVRSPRRAIIRDREAPAGVRGSWLHSHRERAAGDPYTNINVNSYDVQYRERDHRIEWREEIARERDHRIERREEIARENYRIERREEISRENYRAYGLQGDRRNVTASHVIPMLEPYESDYERLHNLDPIYRSNVPAHVESLRTDPLYLSESEYQNYLRSRISDRTEDPYHAYPYGASPRARDASYLHPLSREEIPPSSYLVGGRTLIGNGNLQPHREVLPVSSRYSFAGPSFSRR